MPNSTSASDNPSRPAGQRPRSPKRRRPGRYVLWGLAVALGLPLLLWLFLLTPLGLDTVARLAEQGIAASGMTGRIEHLSGVLPVSLRVGHVSMADKHGTWLEVDDARFSWSPLALLGGRVRIDEISAASIKVARAPDLPPAPKEPSSLQWPPRFPSLPPILLDKLAVGRLVLGKELAGQDATIGIDGRLAESGQGAVGLTLAVTRLDSDKPLALRLAGSLNYAAWKLSTKISLTDAAGGLLASALAGPDGGPLAVELTGDGPLDGWKGHLDTRLAAKTILAADLELAVPLKANASAAFSLDATVTPPPGLLPAETARLLGPAPKISLAGRTGIVSGDLHLDKTTVTTAAGTLTAKASLDPAKDAVSARIRLDLPRAEALSPSLSGAADVTLTADGSLTKPDVRVRLGAKTFGAGSLRLGAADITVAAKPTGAIKDTFPGANVTITGRLTGLSGPEGSTLLGQDLTLDMAAHVDGKGGVTADKAVIKGQGGSVTLAPARYVDGAAAAKLALDIKNVAGAASLGGLHLAGAFAADLDATMDSQGKGKAGLNIRLSALKPTAPDDRNAAIITALLGPAPKIAAQVDFSKEGGRLTALTLDGKAMKLDGTGRFATAGNADAKIRLALPDLGVLAGPLGKPCAGAVDLDVTLGGTTASPHVEARLAAQKPVFGDLALAGLELSAKAADLTGKPSGTVRLAARRDGETASLETGFTLAGDTLTIKGLRLAAPGTALSGDMAVNTATGKATGTLSGKAGDLAGLGRFAGVSLAGSLTLAVTANAAGTAQNATCSINAANLRLPGLSARELAVKADLTDVTGMPRGRADVAVKELAAGDTRLSTLTLAASAAGKGQTALHLETKGTIPGEKKLALTARALFAQAKGGQMTLRLETLTGSLDKRRFALGAPANLAFGGGVTRVDALDLTFDKAKLTASANLGPRSVAAKVKLDNLPLPLLADFGVAEMEGTASLAVTLSGSPARPSLQTEANVSGLRLASEKASGLPAMRITAATTIEAGTCRLKTTLSGAGKKENLIVAATIPMRFSMEPFAFDVPKGGRLSGSVTADNDLKDLGTLLARFNTRLTGRLTADLTLGGTLAAPTVAGTLGLAAKRLENADAGIMFQDVALNMEASAGTLRITKGSGTDGRGGSFTLGGQVSLTDCDNGPVDLRLTLHRLRVAGLDLARITADGSVGVTGTLSRMKAAGTIELGPADINLPSSMPPSVTVIPVTYVNDPNAPKQAAPKTAPPAAARHIDLDITVLLGRSVYVRGLGLESRWAGKLSVTGTAAKPVIVGKYYVEKGTVDLFGTSLAISKGDVVFKGSALPTLDILAENTVNEVTAGIAITGEASSPNINLTSTPSLPRDEILSRILFGQSATTLAPLQAAQLAQAAASLYAGGSPTNMLARTRRILGIDQLSVTSTDSTMSSTVMRAGKEIAKGVTVSVEQGMTAQSGAVSVEVELTPNITVESRAGQDNKQGVGLNWKLDY